MTRAAPPAQVVAALRRPVAGNPLLSFAEDAETPAVEFPGAVPALLAGVAGATGARERRVAASLVVLGYSARLLGPSVSVLLRDGVLVDASPARTRFDYAAGVGFRLAVTRPAGWVGEVTRPAGRVGPDLAARWREVVLDDHLAMVVAAVRAEVRVASGLLWGNIASGLVGALGWLARSGEVAPDVCERFAAAALAHGPLRGSGTLTPGPWLRRRSCCLYYRLPAGGYCGDCCLTPR